MSRSTRHRVGGRSLLDHTGKIMGERPHNDFPIAGVGASAGGLRALSDLFAALKEPPGIAMVVVQHLDPRHESRLTDLLGLRTSLPVVDAVHGLKVDVDHMSSGRTPVAIADGVLSVTPRPDDRRPYYPIDHFPRSLAEVQGPYAMAVILSGTGSDGSLGVCEVKEGRGWAHLR